MSDQTTNTTERRSSSSGSSSSTDNSIESIKELIVKQRRASLDIDNVLKTRVGDFLNTLLYSYVKIKSSNIFNLKYNWELHHNCTILPKKHLMNLISIIIDRTDEPIEDVVNIELEDDYYVDSCGCLCSNNKCTVINYYRNISRILIIEPDGKRCNFKNK